jgi:hypothetical protein
MSSKCYPSNDIRMRLERAVLAVCPRRRTQINILSTTNEKFGWEFQFLINCNHSRRTHNPRCSLMYCIRHRCRANSSAPQRKAHVPSWLG